MSYDLTRKVINGFSFYLRDRIGSGCSSEVFRGQCEKTHDAVAVKVVARVQAKKELNVPLAETEIRCLQKLKDLPHVLQFKSAIQTKNNIYVITELCDRGSLADLISSQRKLTEEKAINLVEQIIDGYKHIAAHQMIHRDLKPMNIFIKGEEVRIGDFGFAIDSTLCAQALNENVGSPLYMPHQTLTGNQYSFKSDIWAIGVIFLEMLRGKTPWKSKTEKELKAQLANFKIQDILPLNISPKSREFLTRTMRKEVDQRMSLNELLGFRFHEQAEETQRASEVPTLTKLKGTLSQNNLHTRSSANFFSEKTTQSSLMLQRQSSNNKSALNLLLPIGSEKIPKRFQENPKQPQQKGQKSQDRVVATPEKVKEEVVEVKKVEPKKAFVKKISLDVNINDFNYKEETSHSTQESLQAFSIPNLPLPLTKAKTLQSAPARIVRAESFLTDRSNTDKTEDSPKNTAQKEKKPLCRRDSVGQTMKRDLSSCHLKGKDNLVFGTIKAIELKPAQPIQQLAAAEREILSQLQSQINYFRFLFKLFKKLNELLKTTDQRLALLKSNLLQLTLDKIEELRTLRCVKGVARQNRQDFLKSKSYEDLATILDKYRARYTAETVQNPPLFSSERDFMNGITYALKILYQNIAKIESNPEELNRKKALVFIVEDLMDLSKLFLLEREENWEKFHLKANIGAVLETTRPSTIDQPYWQAVQARFDRLNKF